MKPMPLREYLADPCPEPSFDSGTARHLITRSPLHAWYQHPRLNPVPADEEHGAALDVGGACHAMLLEDDESRFAIVEADDWRTKAAREARDQAHADGRIPLLARQMDPIRAIVGQSRLAINRCDELKDVFHDAIREQVCLWQDDGAWCRARPDCVSADGDIVLNYKTTAASAEPDGFGSGMLIRELYHLQAYHHARGLWREAGSSGNLPKCLWLIQEVEPPYAASILGASPALTALAEAQWEHALALWRQCLAEARWPAYPSRVCWIEPAAWHADKWCSRHDVSAKAYQAAMQLQSPINEADHAA